MRTRSPYMRRGSPRARPNITCSSCGKWEAKPGRTTADSHPWLCADCFQGQMRSSLLPARARVGAVLPYEQRRQSSKRPLPQSEPAMPDSSAGKGLCQQSSAPRRLKKPFRSNQQHAVNGGGVVTRATHAAAAGKTSICLEDSRREVRDSFAANIVDSVKAKTMIKDCAAKPSPRMIRYPCCSDCRQPVAQGKETCEQCVPTIQKEEHPILEPSMARGDKSMEDAALRSRNGTEIRGATINGRRIAAGSCVKCDRKTDKTMYTGPDGPSTLCGRCGREYMHFRLPLYRRPDGTVTAVYTDGLVRVAHNDFEKRGSSRNLQKPITSPRVMDTDVLNIRKENDLRTELDPGVFTITQDPSAAFVQAQNLDIPTSDEGDRETLNADGANCVSPSRPHDGETEADDRVLNNVPPTGDTLSSKALVPLQCHERRVTDHGLNKVISKKGDGGHCDAPMCMFVKAIYKAGKKKSCRRFPIIGRLPYASFRRKFAEMFGIEGSFILEYSDNEADFVAISTDVEVEELYRVVAAHDISPVRILLTED